MSNVIINQSETVVSVVADKVVDVSVTMAAPAMVLEVTPGSFPPPLVTSTYTDSNVALFLPNYAGSLDASSTITSINSNVSVIASNLDAVVSTVGAINSEVFNLTGNALTQQSAIDALVSNAASQQSTITALNTDVNDLWANSASQHNTLSTLQSNIADLGNVVVSNVNDISALYGNAASQQSSITSLTSEVGNLWSNAASQSGTISSLVGDVGTLNTNAATQQSSITSLTSEVGNLWSNAASQSGTISSLTSEVGNLWSNAASQSDSISTLSANSGVTAGTYGDMANIPQIVVDSKGRITLAGNVAVSIPSSFVGDMTGNTLYDSTNRHITLKAYPINEVTAISSSPAEYATRSISYTGSRLNNASSIYQTAGAKMAANLLFNSSANGSNKQTSGHSATTQITATQTMSSNDRTRGFVSVNALNLNGNQWGNDGSTSNFRPTHSGGVSLMSVEGSGTVGQVCGGSSGLVIVPSGGGSQQSNYATAMQTYIATQGGNSFTSVSTGTARLYSGFMSFNNGHAVTDAIGLHIPNSWAATSGGASITNKYAILVEDTNSPIKTSGLVDASNINVSNNITVGSLFSSGGTNSIYGNDVVIRPYPGNINLVVDGASGGQIVLDGPISQGLQYTNYTTGAFDIGSTYAYPTQVIDNYGALNITITPSTGTLSAMYDFFIFPKVAGTSVTWPAGSIVSGTYDDTIYANNYARVSISAGSTIATVAYINNGGKTFSSNIAAPTFTGNVSATTVKTNSEYVSDSLVFDKTAGKGIKVDTASPTYCWADLLGPIMLRGGAQNPTSSVFRNTIYAYQFALNDEVQLVYHMPHDWVPGSDLFLHAHWAHNNAAVTSGAVTFTADVTFAKGFNQAAFPATKSVVFSQTASTVQYRHMVAEAQISTPGGSATLLDTSTLEVDGLILVRLAVTGNTMNGAPQPFIFTADIHYQSTGIGTKGKAPNFYN